MNAKCRMYLNGFIVSIFFLLIIFGVFIYPMRNNINSINNNQNSINQPIMIFDDSSPPVIDFLQTNPSNPEWYDNISITVEVYDDNYGVQQVILSYSSNLDEYGGFRNKTMTQLSDDIYN